MRVSAAIVVGLLGCFGLACTEDSAVPDEFDWTQFQTDLSAFHAEGPPKLDATLVDDFKNLNNEVIAIIDAQDNEEAALMVAMDLLSGPFGFDGEALANLIHEQAPLILQDAEGVLAWAALPPAHFTVVLMERTLPSDIRKELEDAFGSKLEDVRIHVNDAAQDAAAKLGADGFAPGNAPYFGGDPNPDTLAEEAAHVVQDHAGKAAAETGVDPETKKLLDARRALRKKVAAARSRLDDAWYKYNKLLEDSRKGDLESSGRAKSDIFDVLDAMDEVKALLDEVNELLKELGEKPLELEDLDEQSF